MAVYDIVVHVFNPRLLPMNQDFHDIMPQDPALIAMRLNRLREGPVCFSRGRYTHIYLLRNGIEKHYWYQDVDFEIIKSNDPNSSLIINNNQLDDEGYIYALVVYPFDDNMNGNHGEGPLTIHMTKNEARSLDANLF